MTVLVDVTIVALGYVGIYCECQSDPQHSQTYTVQEIAVKGLKCAKCGGIIVAKYAKILTGRMEGDAKIILKGARDVQNAASRMEEAKKRASS